MPTPETRVPIALLSQTGEPSRHLREALAGAGAPIVYEAHAAQLDRDALEQSGARVVIVNLDAEVDAHLDDVYALLGDDRYNVIFNEAQVSVQLSGWEQARWARHLAAKILGTASADPPRPEGAEPVPVRMPAAPPAESVVARSASAQELATAADSDAEPRTPATAAPTGLDLSAFAAPPPAPPAADEGYDFAATDRLLDQAGQGSAPDPAAAFVTAGSDPGTIDVSEFAAPAAPSRADTIDFQADADDTFADVSSAGPAVDDGDALGFSDLDDFAGDDDFVGDFETASTTVAVEQDDGLDLAFEADPDPEPTDFAEPLAMAGHDLDPAGQIAESADAIEQASDASSLSDLELLDLDWADAPKPPESAESEPVVVPPPPPISHAAFAWTLADVDDDAGEPDATSVADVPSTSNEFGIETITASEFLAPAVDVADAAPPPSTLSSLSLELVPLEEAVAPQSLQPEPVARETWLDTSAFGSSTVVVRKVWVLGASIGGPEAVREFLARIPKDFPALFLLAQHMGPDFMDLMAQQLVRTTALTVRTPTHGERVAHGDIVVVPITHRLRVDAQGVITLEPLAEPAAAHSPSIDQVLRDVADRFGSKAGAIIFSGMAEDAAEGSRYLTGKGGKVFVQDPQTCVISSMVDGVLETGVVGFTGSPHELADRVLGERSKSAATSQGQ